MCNRDFQSIAIAAMCFAVGDSAQASIIWSGEQNIPIVAPPPPVPPNSANSNTYNLDMNFDSIREFQVVYERVSVNSGTAFMWSPAGGAMAEVGGAQLVGAGLSFQSPIGLTGPGAPPGAWTLGARFALSDGTHYGWILLERDTAVVIVRQWAYETTPDAPIVAGAIPTPASGTALAAAVMIGARRRRRSGFRPAPIP